MVNAENISKPQNIYEDGGKTVLEVKAAPYFDDQQYDLNSEKDFNHYIDDIKRIVRSSFEYRWLINYLKNTRGMDECSVLEYVTNRDNSKVRIEIHHSPLTLEDIVLAVVKKRMDKKEDMDVNAVAEEIMYDHFKGLVGLIPLSETVHELVHNQFFFVPTDRVFGDYNGFVNTYYNYIDPSTLDSIDAAEQATKDYDGSQMEMFNNHKIYVNADNNINLDNLDDEKSMIKSHINVIKSKQVEMCRIIDNTLPRT